eukprot:scaffold184679_cov23-Tisochrysis_lutea.AAC.1
MHAPCSSEGLQPHSNAAAMHDPCSGSHKGIGPSLSPIDVDSGREMHVTIGRSSRSTNSGSSNNGGRIMHATIGSSSSSSGGRNARDGLVHVFGAGELTRNGSYDGSVNRGSKEKAMLTFVSVPTLCRHASDKVWSTRLGCSIVLPVAFGCHGWVSLISRMLMFDAGQSRGTLCTLQTGNPMPLSRTS